MTTRHRKIGFNEITQGDTSVHRLYLKCQDQKDLPVNQINPGWVLTERERKMKVEEGMPDRWWEKLSPTDIPSGAMTTPEQLAEGCIYWISDESRPFTATVLDLEQFSFIGRNPEKS